MKRALESVTNVKQVDVNFGEKKAVVTVENESVTSDLLCEALRDRGFTAIPLAK